jgi:hypothetical protein
MLTRLNSNLHLGTTVADWIMGQLITAPAEISPSHEEHFAMVMEEFLDYIDEPASEARWPASLLATIRMRYTLIAHAHTMGKGE